uniref:Rho GTPase activating protein 10 n=1 Tax=Electrophorus electricus TaxID=8005 RepID=A0AAY5EUP4_ELEEL
MGLYPLEFSECYLDSPSFREKIRAHEAELDKTNRFIKELYKDGKNLINATKQLSLAQLKFAQCLGDFQFEYIGDAKTDDEKCIDESLQEFSSFLKNLEDQRELMTRNITETLMKPLEKFRKEQLGSAKAERKKFEKETEKYYTTLEKLLNMSSKKKEPQLQEVDSLFSLAHFQDESLEYICKLQEIQERKKFECVEPLLAFFQTMFTFYHQGFELANDFDHYKRALQINIQNTRSRFEGTRSEVYDLLKKFKEAPQEYRQTSPISSEGYLYMQEKRPPPFGSSWVKRYCTFVKEQKILHMVTFDPKSGGKFGETESVTLKSCQRKTTDTLDRRFCLDLEITDRPGTVFTAQALSEDDHRFWVQEMGGKEPVKGFGNNSCINDQGLYRVVGVSSKVQKLLNLMIDEKSEDVELSSCEDWDVKTITSALKIFLRWDSRWTLALVPVCVGLLKSRSPEARAQAIHCLVHKLPESNRHVLSLVTQHLANVASHSKQNLMTVANLGVVFGPTLMRPQEETVAAIMDLKFQNIVVEILIEHHEKIFGDAPSLSVLTPFSAHTRQSKKQSRTCRPLAVYNPQVLDIHTGRGLRKVCGWPCSNPEVCSRWPLQCVTVMKAKAVYPCEAEHDSELSFQVGAIFHAGKEPGWLEGELEGKRGLIPENYVEIL